MEEVQLIMIRREHDIPIKGQKQKYRGMFET